MIAAAAEDLIVGKRSRSVPNRDEVQSKAAATVDARDGKINGLDNYSGGCQTRHHSAFAAGAELPPRVGRLETDTTAH